jgi:hypothetical protein
MKEPVIIVGDIHGQFYDMIHMFEKVVDQRNLPKSNMLFLGDYVDRGNYSIEVCIFLYCLKINFPNEVIMLRGNHESRAMTEHFTFREEVLKKYDNDENVYELFIESFEAKLTDSSNHLFQGSCVTCSGLILVPTKKLRPLNSPKTWKGNVHTNSDWSQ